MSVETTIVRVEELRTAMARIADPAAVTGGTAAPGSFATMLRGAMTSSAPAAATATAGPAGMLPGAGAAMPGLLGAGAAGPLGAVPALGMGGSGATAALAAAQAEVGQVESPPGSNDSPRIAQYRTATAGAAVGPWCAYFASWAARQGGVPLGDRGEGFGSVDAVWAWGQRTGRAMPASAATPSPGDLIVWDEHIGIVEAVLPDGRIQTIEGNSSNMVARRVHARGDAIGYVRLG
jgi:CHAP domain